jgi:hypothetical protein
LAVADGSSAIGNQPEGSSTMPRHHHLLAAALIATATSAVAQSTPSTAPPGAPATTAPAPVNPAPSAGMPLTATPPNTAASLAPNQFLGSKLDGANVYNAANEKIADVEDMVIDAQGQIVAVILGYGGLAGIGRSYVAVQPSQLTVRRVDNDELRVQASMTVDDLRRAPQFSYTARNR